MTRDKVQMGGSFAQAIVDNNLREAINRADDTCIKYLKFFSIINYNCGSYEIEHGE
jgi:flavin-binding protein dodecin